MSNDLNLVNNGRMYRENSLNAAAVSYTSNGKGLLDAAVSLSDNGALLLAFLDSYVYLYSVAHFKSGNFALHAGFADKL